jgi:hypothetical protein
VLGMARDASERTRVRDPCQGGGPDCVRHVTLGEG